MRPDSERRGIRVRTGPRMVALGLAIAGCLAAAFPTAALVHADDAAGAFAGTAQASSVRTAYSIPNFLILETFIDGGGPVAQAVYESSGLARAFGSAPYPGDTAVALPGLVASFGGPSGLPGYPLYASADYPVVPEQTAGDPSGLLTMHAKAGTSGSEGSARAFGGTTAGASDESATSSVKRRSDGAVEAKASSLVEGLSLGGGVLKITSVRSSSSTLLKPGSTKRVTRQELQVDGASVGGTGVTFGPNGLVLLGQPAPLSLADTTKALNDQLAAAGLSVRVVRGEAVKGGVASDALEIRSEEPLPIPGGYKGINTLVIGSTTTSVIGGLAARVSAPGVAGVLAGPAPVSDASSSQAGTATNDRSGVATGGAVASGGSLAAAPGSAATVRSARTVRVARDLRPKMRLVYALFVATGLVGLTGMWVLRRKGVTTSWTL